MKIKNYLLKITIILFLFNQYSISAQEIKSTSSSATQGAPFNCDYYAYLFQFNDVYSIDLASGNSLLVAENITDGNINAAGYNNADGYIWGSLSSPSKSIVRIGNDYSTDTYYIPELPTAGRYIGDIDTNGMYYLKNGGTTVYKIDLDPNSSSYLESAGTLTLDTNITIHDWAFNSLDGALYTVEKNTNVLYRIDISTGTVTSLGEVPILAGNSYTYGAVYFDAAGNFYVSANQTGTIYIVYGVQDLTGSNAISSNFFAFGPASSSNDGARCPTAAVAQEDCSNGIDDDGDGLVDCDDLSCSGVGDCEVNTGASGGNNGGLESNNRLSQKINKRNYWRVKQNFTFNKEKATRIKKTSKYKSKSAQNVELRDFIPLDVLVNTETIESTPSDLLGITNAIEVLSVDYLRNSKNIAAILATKTTKGAYEHTKYICDRLLGAEILSVSTIQLQEKDFIKTLIKHPNGEKEFVVSFSIKLHATNTYMVDSHWNLDRYDATADYYNFQVWSNSIDDVYKLCEEILALTKAQKPIESYNTSRAPAVYVKKGVYKNGKIDLQIINTDRSNSLTIDGGLRKTETSATENVNFSMSINNNYSNSVSLELGYLFDMGFRIHSGANNTPDDLFMSDGSWGVDDAATSTQVSTFNVTPHQQQTVNEGLIVERDVHLKAETSEYVSVYKSFTPTFQPIDLTGYNTLSFKAFGTGKLVVTLLKKNIEVWESQYRTQVSLTNEEKEFTISFDEFLSNTTEDFLPNDITTVIFSMISEDGALLEKVLTISNINFSMGEVLSIDDISLGLQNNKRKINIAPNPMRSKSTISFLSEKEGTCELSIYSSLGALVARKTISASSGLNTLSFEKRNLRSGLYFVKIRMRNLNYKTGKLLIK